MLIGIGFSFKGPLRSPWDIIIKELTHTSIPIIVSVDIPSGWDVDQGPTEPDALQPHVLISLTAPKRAALYFKGPHYLAGRFLTLSLMEKYSLQIPLFLGAAQFVKLTD